MNALKIQSPSPQADSDLPRHLESQLQATALLSGALSGLQTTGDTDVAALPAGLLATDKILRLAAAAQACVPTPDGLAERTLAKCLTLALDGSMAGEVVV